MDLSNEEQLAIITNLMSLGYIATKYLTEPEHGIQWNDFKEWIERQVDIQKIDTGKPGNTRKDFEVARDTFYRMAQRSDYHLKKAVLKNLFPGIFGD